MEIFDFICSQLMWLAGKVGIIVLTLENYGAQAANDIIHVKKIIIVKHKEYLLRMETMNFNIDNEKERRTR